MVELLGRIAATFDTYCWPSERWVTAEVVPHRQHVRFTTWADEQYELPVDWMVAAAVSHVDHMVTA